ncbi:hypothetical protein [Neobacillus sp. Marseille-QA0830]
MRSMRKMPFFNLFMPKQKSRGTMWASLLGLGISAAVFGLTRGKRQDMALPITKVMNNMTSSSPNENRIGQKQQDSGKMGNLVKNLAPNFNLNQMDNAALAEFSEELMESALNKKQ